MLFLFRTKYDGNQRQPRFWSGEDRGEIPFENNEIIILEAHQSLWKWFLGEQKRPGTFYTCSVLKWESLGQSGSEAPADNGRLSAPIPPPQHPGHSGGQAPSWLLEGSDVHPGYDGNGGPSPLKVPLFSIYIFCQLSQSILKKFCNGLVCFELENYLATRLSNCGWLNVWFGFTFLVSLGSFLHFFPIHEFLLLQDSQPIANFISHSIIFVFPSFD